MAVINGKTWHTFLCNLVCVVHFQLCLLQKQLLRCVFFFLNQWKCLFNNHFLLNCSWALYIYIQYILYTRVTVDCHNTFVGSVIQSEMFCSCDWENPSHLGSFFSALTRAITRVGWTTGTSQLVAESDKMWRLLSDPKTPHQSILIPTLNILADSVRWRFRGSSFTRLKR